MFLTCSWGCCWLVEALEQNWLAVVAHTFPAVQHPGLTFAVLSLVLGVESSTPLAIGCREGGSP